MTDLLPVEPYLRLHRRALLRAALVRAALGGVPLTVLLLVAGGSVLGVVSAILIGASAGLIFGVARVLRLVRSERAMTRRVYRGESSIALPPPEGRPDYRLMCYYVAGSWMEVTGHLYAAPDVLTFIPYSAGIRRYMLPPLVIPTGPSLEIDVDERGPPPVTRHPVRLLQIRTAGIKAAFVTPEPDTVAAKLRDYYRCASPST